MAEKPSLYVVEKKEVVILVVLFVLVTVLSFTMGVRYGESVGRKSAQEKMEAEAEHSHEEMEKVGGTLGEKTDNSHTEHNSAKAISHEDEKKSAAHDDPTSDHESHSAAPKAENTHEEHAAVSHEEKATPLPSGSKTNAKSLPPAKDAVDKNSDEYLLDALKETGVESPGGKAPREAKLPQESKQVHIPSGSFVIQVGSHPTRLDAESQVKQLKAKKVSAEVLPPFTDSQGEWHRVVVGSYKGKKEADAQAKMLLSKGVITSFFVRRLP